MFSFYFKKKTIKKQALINYVKRRLLVCDLAVLTLRLFLSPPLLVNF